MTPHQSTSLLGALSRLLWLMLCPMVLLLLTLAIINAGPSWLTAADLAFLVVLGTMILARWLEFRAGAPQTATGEPATVSHLQRYAIFAAIVGLVVWIVANLLANYWMAG